MAAFINPEDYDASIHQEILDSLIRSDKQIIEICEDRAITEMRGYLSARYACNKVFSAEGEDRNQLVVNPPVFVSEELEERASDSHPFVVDQILDEPAEPRRVDVVLHPLVRFAVSDELNRGR